MEYFSNSGCFIQPLEEKHPGLSYVQQRDTESGSVRQVAVADTFQRIPLTPLLNRGKQVKPPKPYICTEGITGQKIYGLGGLTSFL